MHGAIALARTGRKRKAGQRTPAGRLRQAPAINYRALAALQPHRIALPEKLRLSQDAATELGCLYLRGHITESEYLAGQEYSRRIGQYMATIEPPHSTMTAAGRWSGCNPATCPQDRPCECRCRRNDYMELQHVVAAEGHRVEVALKRLLMADLRPALSEIVIISVGLSALAKHLRLTNGNKSRQRIN